VSKVFVVNPGSTSTKVALFENDAKVFACSIAHSLDDLNRFKSINDQFEFRCLSIDRAIESGNIHLAQIDAFVGRGGLLQPIPSGTYIVDEAMLNDLKNCVGGEHASNLGALIVDVFAKTYHKPAFIVDPVVVDELDDIARLSGHPLFPRKSIFHALNQKAVARQAAKQLGLPYEKLNLIVAHLGGGISVGAHSGGRVIDVNNALDGEGAYSPERSGTLPMGDVIRYCYSGFADSAQTLAMIKGQGGLAAYLGSNNMQSIKARIEAGDKYADLIYRGMAYQIAKQIGENAVVLKGKVDVIILTGGITNDKMIVARITEFVSFLAPVMIFPGEEEMQALAEGAMRILNGEEKAHIYNEQILIHDYNI
jgi:butyrate kinase